MTVPASAADSAGDTVGYTASLVQTPAPGSLLAVDSATDTIYLATSTGVIVVNGATNTVTTTITTPAPVSAIAVDSATNTVYLAASPTTPGPEIDVISGATNTVTTSITVPSGITSIAVDSTTNTVYAAEPTLAQVTVVNGATNAITTNVSTGTGTRPSHLTVDETSDTVWVADENGSVIGIDGATNKIASDFALSGTEPYSLAVNEGSNTIYVADLRNDQVIVLDGTTGTVITDIPVGIYLYGVDVDQSSGLIYASSYGGSTGTTWVINSSTNEIEDSIARGSLGVVVDQATGVIYEPDLRAPAIWILTAASANTMSPVITSGGSTGFIVGDAGSFTVTASALPAATFSETGPLPSGLTMTAGGVLSGTPAAGTGGLYPITVTASNGVAPDYTQQLEVLDYQAAAITSGDSATFQVGTAGSFALTATGYTAPSFTSSGSLPAGLSITDQTPGGWQISGTPAAGAGGVYQLTILAYNGVAPEAQQAFTLTVNEAPAITSSASATFTAGTAGSYQIAADGYPTPAVTETGALPTGVTLTTAGVLAGTPAAGSGGVYTFTISASNGIGTPASQAFSLTVDQAPSFTSASRATFLAGARRKFVVRTTGFPAAALSERGGLPRGVRFRARSNGAAVLIGTAPRSDRGKTYVITIIASNGIGPRVRQTFRLKIS
jgi:large repetitive protein